MSKPVERKDPLEFIRKLDERAKSLSGDRTTRKLDAVDQLLADNARLNRELAEAKEENQRLRQQLNQQVATPSIPVKAPVVTPPKEVDPAVEDDTKIRFSMLELD